MQEQLVMAADVAAKLQVTEARVFELARMKLLPCVRIGRQVRFVPEQINAWVQNGGQALPKGWRCEDDY